MSNQGRIPILDSLIWRCKGQGASRLTDRQLVSYRPVHNWDRSFSWYNNVRGRTIASKDASAPRPIAFPQLDVALEDLFPMVEVLHFHLHQDVGHSGPHPADSASRIGHNDGHVNDTALRLKMEKVEDSLRPRESPTVISTSGDDSLPLGVAWLTGWRQDGEQTVVRDGPNQPAF